MPIFKSFLHVVLLSVVLYASSLMLDEVLKRYKNNRLKGDNEAIILLEKEANSGNTNAAFLLASAYKNGKFGHVDIDKAITWYKVAASYGDGDAMLMLGWLYYAQSEHIDANIHKARYWFKQAALKGVDEAIEMLEMMRQ